MGLLNKIYSPVVKDEYKLTLYTSTHSDTEYFVYRIKDMQVGDYSGPTRHMYVMTRAASDTPVLEGYPTTVTRGEKIKLPVLEDQPITNIESFTSALARDGVPESEWGNYKLKFLGWFERANFTKPNEQPITEIDTSVIGGDIQLYAIFEPAVLNVIRDGNGATLSTEMIDTTKNPLGRFVYPIFGHDLESAFEFDSEGNYIKKAASNRSYSFYLMTEWDENSTSMYLAHPYATSSEWYDGSNNAIRWFVPTSTTGKEVYVYADNGVGSLASFGIPNPAEEN